MPRVRRLGGPDYEKIFGRKLKAIVVEKELSHGDVAKVIGRTGRTLTTRFAKPSDMTLGELKSFIKYTGLKQAIVIQYLYETGEE